MLLRFGDCVLDPSTRELWRAGETTELSPQELQLLLLLIEQRPRPLRHDALRDALWPDTHVTHTALARIVSQLRRAVGDSAEQGRLIRTVSRFGYAFVAPVVGDAGSGRPGECALTTPQREFALPEGETLVGRGVECGVQLASPEVSRVHARVRVHAGNATVEDQGSKNGTFVNGRRVSGQRSLEDGDEVLFGTYRLVFRRSIAHDSTRSPPT